MNLIDLIDCSKRNLDRIQLTNVHRHRRDRRPHLWELNEPAESNRFVPMPLVVQLVQERRVRADVERAFTSIGAPQRDVGPSERHQFRILPRVL